MDDIQHPRLQQMCRSLGLTEYDTIPSKRICVSLLLENKAQLIASEQELGLDDISIDKLKQFVRSIHRGESIHAKKRVWLQRKLFNIPMPLILCSAEYEQDQDGFFTLYSDVRQTRATSTDVPEIDVNHSA